MKVMIVEDEALFGLGLEDEISEAGHTVIGPIPSVKGALSAAEAESPELALVDLDMHTRQDPIELTRELRARDVPSLVMSSQNARASQVADIAIGFIAKPFRLDEACGAIAVAVEIISGGKPPPPPLPRSLTLFRHT
jgi:DNA-binding response OmpR family regulator